VIVPPGETTKQPQLFLYKKNVLWINLFFFPVVIDKPPEHLL